MQSKNKFRYLSLGVFASVSVVLFVTTLEFAIASDHIAPKDLTLEDAKTFTDQQMYEYKQARYQRVDPAGDLLLFRRTAKMFGGIYRVMIGKEQMANPQDLVLPEEIDDPSVLPPPAPTPERFIQTPASFATHERESRINLAFNHNRQLSFQGRKNPILRDGFLEMLLQVIQEERSRGIEPTLGQPHEWSKEFKDNYGTAQGIALFPKLLVALSSGLCSVYLRTDLESPLLKWILSQPHNSITIPELFRSAYRFASGDIYLTLLTIENVLSKHWRNPNRSELALTKRLTPIANGYNYSADRFGTWYHFFGTMLYGYVEGRFSASTIGRIESLGSTILSKFQYNQQKAWLNIMGGVVGNDLQKAIRKKKYLSYEIKETNLVRETYLNLSEDYRDRIHIAKDPDITPILIQERDFVTLKIRHEGREQLPELENCKLELLVDRGAGFHSDLIRTEKITSLRPGQSQDFSFFLNNESERIEKIRGFISGCTGFPPKFSLAFEEKAQ